jgi:uncharacterized protein YjbI with pentapeptide repeats
MAAPPLYNPFSSRVRSSSEATVIVPKRAPVRPRVLSPATGETLLLEDLVRDLVAQKKRGLIQILGGIGSGKTTALGHLAEVMGDQRIVFTEDPVGVVNAVRRGWVVFAAPALDNQLKLGAMLHLAPWGEDEWIECLLAEHRHHCSSVMTRLRADPYRTRLQGNPQLWRVALAAMAASDTLATVRDALLHIFRQHLPEPTAWPYYRMKAVEELAGYRELSPPRHLKGMVGTRKWARTRKLFRHRSVQIFLAGKKIAEDIADGKRCAYLERRFPRYLVDDVAAEVRSNPKAISILQEWCELRSPVKRFLGMLPDPPLGFVASILHACQIGWQPTPKTWRLNLSHGYFDHAKWVGIALLKPQLIGTDVSFGDLSEAKLHRATAEMSRFIHANLQYSTLFQLQAGQADFSHADLAHCNAQEAKFRHASLKYANLRWADLTSSSFFSADLTGACFANANLHAADLCNSILDGADFSGANFQSANLSGLVLRAAEFGGARFTGAVLAGCNLEDMELPNTDFREADLRNALLTGSFMAGSNFDGAKLASAGLAQVEWEGVSLRGADLRGASFHLGSSRSGLVGSPLACEGSRTGFYTDDFTEQDFKAPEEIRKANLCHADLRGARIDGVDFYLVDLRHAQFDAEQEERLRLCGAILETRAAGIE